MDDQVSLATRDYGEAGRARQPQGVDQRNGQVDARRAGRTERCISDDNTTAHNFDRYSDSAAAKMHLEAFLANYAGRYMAAVDTSRLSVYGAPSDEVKVILNGFGAVYFGLIEGFTR
jgi:hypothetical protein